jgi:toxin ParE1/3/4
VKILFHELAQAELIAAAEEYESQHKFLGREFVATVKRSLERLSAFPESGTSYVAGTRRLVLGRFPYSVVYFREGDSIIVVAIAHHRRMPSYWTGRR